MEKKIKNILLSFFAICLASVGAFILTASRQEFITSAETSIVTDLKNNTPDFFSIEELNIENEAQAGSLIKDDIFLYNSATNSHIKLSLATNGTSINGHDVYQYVYYPDKNNLSTFYFYQITGYNLYINGVEQTLTQNFVTGTGHSFANDQNNTILQTFEMNFSNAEPTEPNNTFKITDENGKLIEGLYTLTLNVVLYTCTDGGTSAVEEKFSSEITPITYSFLVLDQSRYSYNSRPIITANDFSESVTIPSSISATYGNYYYYNYSNCNENSPKVSSISYNMKNYDLAISKTLNSSTFTQNLIYNFDENILTSTGDENVLYTIEGDICTIYFQNVGNYSLSFNSIATFDINGTLNRYSLESVSNITKKIMVYVYGYQATYVDYDNAKVQAELKNYNDAQGNFNNGIYDGADITASFINSNPAYGQNANAEDSIGSTTFLISNVTNYINNKSISPVLTNQSPIRFISNATLCNGDIKSYVYSTTQVNNNFEKTSYSIGSDKLYKATYTGGSISDKGKYIYILAYTFNNYFTSNAQQNNSIIFYQVFYFEITGETPTIELNATDGTVIYSDSFINQNVTITNPNLSKIYCKDVTVQIYAYDYVNDKYMEEFGGENGTSMANLTVDSTYTLEYNAHYTIRIYYTSEITTVSTNINTISDKIKREYYFTIDKIGIANITARNVTPITNSTNYNIKNEIKNGFSTNQNIILSWNTKASDAVTYAYYRYFALENTNFYEDTSLSNTLQNYLRRQGETEEQSYLPINYQLNLSTEDNSWLKYAGNTKDFTSKVSSEYVLSSAGLYIVDVYDQAGNHGTEIFMIDNTNPIFALKDSNGYSLISSSMYISEPSTLYWAKYKAIKMGNFNSPIALNSIFSLDEINSDDFEGYSLFKNYKGNVNIDIFKKFYEKLYQNKNLQYLTDNTTSIPFITIANESISYQTPIDDDDDSNDDEYQKVEGQYSKALNVSNKNYVFKMLIRDESNNKFVDLVPEGELAHYTSYYNAKQSIIVSFDTSNFRILYYDDNNNEETLMTNNRVNGVDENGNKTSTIYLQPTNLKTALQLAFTPTTVDETTIQVDFVTVKYYEYVEKSENIYGVTYFYYELSDSPTSTSTIYSFERDGQSPSETIEAIRLDSNNFTSEGKYVIERTYTTDSAINDNDFYKLTYILIVDRNEVISSPKMVSDNSHAESLVGGDIFVAMYDSGKEASLVVTFPNSEEGNSNANTVYNNSNTPFPESMLTTNKLPVRVYVPTYKYTTAVVKTNEEGEYQFEVTANSNMNYYYDSNVIKEYLLYAQIYKDGKLLYKTDSSFNTASTSENGFLIFYDLNGTPVKYLSDEGVYTVEIYQGFLSTDFKQRKAFTFTVEKPVPDFTAKTTYGEELKYDTSSGVLTYHTNQDEVQILWKKSSDEFSAELDQNKITISINGGEEKVVKAGELFSTMATAGEYYRANLNLRAQGIYFDGGYIDITMQYENHDGTYYETVHKRIYVDLQAPHTNIDNLVAQVTDSSILSYLISERDLRAYYDINKNTVSSNTSASYNVSNAVDEHFKFYSYAVTADYIDVLKNTNNSEASAIYVNKLGSQYLGQETDPYDFLASKYTNLLDMIFETGNYYEIVECDLAGNLTIYTIYLCDYSSSEEYLFSYTNSNGEQTFNKADYNETISATAHSPLLNIYSPTSFTLNDINYFGNAWVQFKAEIISSGVGRTYTFMMSPWLEDGKIYQVSGSTFTEFNIANILDGSSSSIYKNILSFYDVAKQDLVKFYFNVRSTILSANTSTVSTREYISFSQPTNSEIESTSRASTYLTDIYIYTPATTINPTITEYYKQMNNLGYADLWQSNEYINVSYTNGKLTFEFNPQLNISADTRIVYEYTDNYGNHNREVHLYNETNYVEISSSGTLYSYYNSANQLTYITDSNFIYRYNENKYTLQHYQLTNNGWETLENLQTSGTEQFKLNPDRQNSIITNTYSSKVSNNYNLQFKIVVSDSGSGDFIKEIYFTLYNEIPVVIEGNSTTENGFRFESNGNNITSDLLSENISYYSKVTLYYNQTSTFLPSIFLISTDNQTWEEIDNGSVISCTEDSTTYYLKVWYNQEYIKQKGYINQYGLYSYIFDYVPDSQIYTFTLSSSLQTAYYVTKTVNGITTVVNKSGNSYIGADGHIYSNHYTINIHYANRETQKNIVTNQEQYIEATELTDYYIDSDNIRTYIYKITNLPTLNNNGITNIPKFETEIAITYIEESDQIVSGFYTYNSAGIIDRNANLISLSSKDYIVPNTSTINQVKIQWSKYHAISSNTITITITKNGSTINPTILSEIVDGKEYNYTYLTRSGKYKISFEDTSGNKQIFNKGNTTQSDTFTFVFLKDIPFNITYTNPMTQQEETTEPISQAIYNGKVTIKLDENTKEYYSSEGVQLKVTKNGVEYSDYTSDNNSFIFTDTGYYSITFSANSSKDNSEIKTQTYYFTILNPNEYRYSFIINKYSNYYIEKIAKNSVTNDVTELYIKTLDLSKITVNGNVYLSELILSYLDEKTGAGTYYITVNSNEMQSDLLKTSWTFKVIIQVGSNNLIYASIEEGASTSNAITVSFNASNVYNEFGESTFRIVSYNTNGSYNTHYMYSVDETSTGVISTSITNTNTYFLQLVSPSGNLLYSYKVIKTEPLNAAAIIAIIISVIVVIGVIILIIKLRKKIAIK